MSDGTESPAELIAAAVEAGLDVVAITDHDSTSGWEEAFAAAAGTGLTVVPGLELSTQLDYASVHVLGYLVDPADPGLVAATERIREERLHRAESMVSRIAADYALDWDDVLAQTTPGATVGRPHIADALVARGHVPDRSAAFASILHWRGGYYRPHEAPPPRPQARQRSSLDLLRTPGMLRLLLVNWLVASSWDMHTFLVPILGHERGFSASAIGFVLGAFALAVSAVRVVIPLLAHHLREAQVLAGAMLLTAAVFCLYPWAAQAWQMAVLATTLGVALGAVQPMVMSTLHQITPHERPPTFEPGPQAPVEQLPPT